MTCFPREALLSYQACDGGWTPLDETVTTANRGLRVTTQWENSTLSYILKVRQQGRSQDFSKGGGVGVTLCEILSSWRFRHGIL